VRHFLTRGLILAVALGAVGGVGRARAAGFSLDDCRNQIGENPRNPAAYYCAYRWVLAGGAPDEAARLLRQSLDENPKTHRIEMFIAWIDRMRGRTGWETLLRQSIDGMESGGDAWGMVYAGLDLAFELGEQGRLDEVDALLERCTLAAEKTGEESMKARVWIGQARLARLRGDPSLDLHLTLRAHKAVFPEAPYDIQEQVVTKLGAAYWYLCRYQNAFRAFEQAGQISEEAGDVWAQGRASYNMALCGVNLVEEGRMDVADYRVLLNKTVALAEKSGNGALEAEVEILLGQQVSGEEALVHFQKALDIGRAYERVGLEVHALQYSAITLAEMGEGNRNESETRLRQAIEMARDSSRDFLLAELLAARARIKALHSTREEAVAAHLKALNFIESLRAAQVGGTIRAQSFARWADVYYRLAGFLLDGLHNSSSPAEDEMLAFETMERYRGRELLERLEAPHLESAEHAGGTSQVRAGVLEQISRVQRDLADPDLDEGRRRKALEQLGDLEEEESVLRDRLLKESGRSPVSGTPEIPDLLSIQKLLGADQALLSYQLWNGESQSKIPLEIGRSWLVLVSRDDVKVWALPLRTDLRNRIEILEGLLANRDPGDAAAVKASVRLYGDLLGEPLADAKNKLRRLVIIPDGALFRCPFGFLRPAEAALPIGGRFDISIVPSAAVWAALRAGEAKPDPGVGAAMVLSDPAIGESVEQNRTFRSAGPWLEGLKLAPLRHAAEEARAMRRVAGRGSVVLSGAEASEAALKERPLSDFRILDLVTHAVVDDRQPERSAILLAPGSEAEDGFLQVREIPQLDLDGQLVVLSSCRSSSGQILGGEGAQSLAHAFLEAGAGAVLASLWPLEDREGTEFFSDFSNFLGRGESVGEALRRAREEAIHSGAPAAGWAGIVLLGNGDLRPLPAKGRRWWLWAVALLGFVAPIVRFVFKRRR
jgi:CHAT domain-containing protein/tetratricopeptide (TPR) repeat protein